MDPISKSRFKARALEYFRQVEQTGQEIVITDRGRPVLRLVPYQQSREAWLGGFRGMICRYDDPLEPVGEDEWEALG